MITEIFRDSLQHPASIILGSTVTLGLVCYVDEEIIKRIQASTKQILLDPVTSLMIGFAAIGALVVADKTLPHFESIFRLAIGRPD